MFGVRQSLRSWPRVLLAAGAAILLATSVVPAAPAAAAGDCARFVADVTMPDGTSVNPNQTVQKVWRLQNCGTTTWSGVQAVRVGGGYGPGSFGVPAAKPGQTVDLSVGIQAPGSAGLQRATYQLQRGSTRFGQTFWIELRVNAPPPPPKPAPAPAPAPKPQPAPPPPPPAPAPVSFAPAVPMNANVKPQDYASCLVYAQRKRGGVPSAGGNTGAYNLLYKNNAGTGDRKPVTPRTNVSDLRTVVAPGWAIVWDRDAARSVDRTYGHIAIVERVDHDTITISQSNYRWNGVMQYTQTLTLVDLKASGTYLFGADANNLTRVQ